MALSLALGITGQAIVFQSTADPMYNAPALGGALPEPVASLWDYQGTWGVYLGTAIGPNHFITAKHVGAPGSKTFTYQGVAYTATTESEHPTADLSIWKVDGTFPSYAPLYTANNEVGRDLYVIGRGTQRGAEVEVNGQLKGWREGTADQVTRWGVNQVSGVSGSDDGRLVADFTRNGGQDEAFLTLGDSGGPVFVQDPADSQWKLAGINLGVDASYRLEPTGSTFRGAMVDQGGLYVVRNSGVTFPDDTEEDVPARFYATRISTYSSWIGTQVPEPAHYALLTGLGLSGMALWRRRRRA